MRILWIVPITSPDDSDLKKVASHLRSFSFQETEIAIRKVTRGTESIESRVDEAYAALPILEEVSKAEKEGFDACIIACAGDAGVAIAKEASTIPVIGPGEASLLISQLIGRRIVVVTTLPERIPSLREKVSSVIPAGQFFIYAAHLPVVELQKNVERTIETVTRIIRESKERDSVDTAILGCLSMIGMAEKVQEKVGIPVIDQAVAALEMAQVLVKMKLSQAKGAYPSPPFKKRSLSLQ